MQWTSQFSAASDEERPPLLDIRSATEFAEWHVAGATHFDGLHEPDGLLCRLNELPAPSSNVHLAILASTVCDANDAIAGLTARGHSTPILLSEPELRTLPSAAGYVSRALWLPAPVLACELPRVMSSIGGERTALDVGSGSGRDSAYLAGRGFCVTAVDRDSNLLSMAERFGNREARNGGKVNTVFRTFGAHLKEDREWLRQNKSGLLLVVRFLRRGVLELLPEGVKEGGFVIYEHFLKGCEKFGGPKKDSQMLQPGELGKIFSEEKGFVVLRDDEETLADGRPVVRFVARKTFYLDNIAGRG